MAKTGSSTKGPPPPTCVLVDTLRHLKPAGPCGIEGLVRDLLEQLTGRTYRLARSGGQFGHDARSTDSAAPVIFVEAKKYEDNTGLSRRELAGELAEAVDQFKHVDLWVLAATKEVGSNEDGLVKRMGVERGVEILILDTREAGAGPLQVLCAAYADTTTAFMNAHAPAGAVDVDVLSQRLDEIRKGAGYNNRLQALEKTIGGLLLGYADACARMADWLRRHMATVADSSVAFNQDVALTAKGRYPIRREFIARDLDAWWAADAPAHFALLGAKGTGKTWAVFSWLLDLLDSDDASLVIPVTSNMAPRADVLDVVADTLERCLRDTLGKPSLWWRRRIAFWLSAPASPVRLLLVLDGLNEAPEAPWRALLASAGATDIGTHVRLLMTCREPYWNERIPVAPGSATVRRTTGYEGDDDTHKELRQALGPSLTPEKLPNELLAFVRQPLYCDLVVTHFRELVETEDITVERLLYLESRENYHRKLGQPITDQQFHEILGCLARRHLKAWREGGQKPRFSKSDLTALVPAGNNAPAILQDIIDGGLLRPSGRHSQPYEVDARRLTYGLGMLLAEHLEDCDAATVDDLAEAAQAWLEPHPDMDLKTSAVGAAVFFALDQTMPGYPAQHRQALLRLWIKARNRDEPTGHAVAAYFRKCPDDILAVADHFWRVAHDHPAAQRAYATVLLERWNNPALQDHLVAAVGRWMGYVHANGHPVQRLIAEHHPERPSPADRLAQELGISAKPGTAVPFHDWDLPITDDDGHLRLARFAVMLMSGGRRRPFLEGFVRWAVSRRLMEFPDECCDEVAWTLRLADEELWPALEPTLLAMAGSANDTVRRSADMVLKALGDCEALSLRDRALAGLHEVSDERRTHLADPCTAHYALKRDQCEPCLGRPDVALHRLLEKVGRYFVDPSLLAQEAFVERLRASARNFAGDHFWRFDGASAESLAAEQHLPALARFAPDALGNLMRQAWKSREARTSENTRGLMINLKAISPLLPPGTMMELGAFLSYVPVDDASGRSDGRTAEAYGFVALAMILPSEATALRLVYRSPAALDLTILEPWLRPLPPGTVTVFAERLLVETDPVRAARILWLMQRAKPTLTDRHRSVILAAAQGDHHRLSAAALEFIVRTRDPDLVSGILEGSCTFTSIDDRSTRNDWGIAVLCGHADRLSFADLLERLPISAIGRALIRRGTMERDANWYADIVDAAWRALGGTNQGGFDLEPPEITVDGVDGEQIPRVGEPRRKGETRFVSMASTWGGQAIDATADAIRAALAPDPNALELRQNRYFEAFYQAVKQDQNGFWRMPVNTDVLRAMYAVRPDLVRSWVDAVMCDKGVARSLLRRADAFYQSLCHALVNVDPRRAFELRDRLRRIGHMRFLVTKAGSDELTALPFSAPETPDALAARQAMLDEAMSDSALLDLATMATAFRRGDWIAEKARELASSPFLWRKAKGAMLATLSDLDEAVVDHLLSGVEEDVAGSWVERLIPAIREKHQRNGWARYWYRQFLAASSWDEAYAAFTLFLNATDRRCRLWMDVEDEEARRADGFDDRKLSYRRTNEDAVDRAIDVNEKGYHSRFLTLQFKPGQLVPFGAPL